jgi:hypothetical protein
LLINDRRRRRCRGLARRRREQKGFEVKVGINVKLIKWKIKKLKKIYLIKN